MAYIIAEPCIGTKDTACVDVCPVDCIHPAKGRTWQGWSQGVDATLACSLLSGVSKPNVLRGR